MSRHYVYCPDDQKVRDDEGCEEVSRQSAGNNETESVKGNITGAWRKKRKRRKTKNKQRPPTTTHVVVNFPSSSDEVEQAECSIKRDSSSSLSGPSNRHSSLRESLLTVLGKLVVWKGTRYRPTPTTSSAPPNSPPPTECIGRSTVFFSSGECITALREKNKFIESAKNKNNNKFEQMKFFSPLQTPLCSCFSLRPLFILII